MAKTARRARDRHRVDRREGGARARGRAPTTSSSTREQDFDAEARRLTGGRGVDVVYDSVGKTTFEKSLDALAPRGMLVLFGQSSGPVGPFDPQVLNGKGSLFLDPPDPRTTTCDARRAPRARGRGARLGQARRARGSHRRDLPAARRRRRAPRARGARDHRQGAARPVKPTPLPVARRGEDPEGSEVAEGRSGFGRRVRRGAMPLPLVGPPRGPRCAAPSTSRC